MAINLIDIKQKLTTHLQKREQFDPDTLTSVHCPYPITILGNDNDTTGGKSLTAALDIYTTLIFYPNDNENIKLYIKEVPGIFKTNLNNIGVAVRGDWVNAVKGAAKILKEKYNIKTGFTGVFSFPFPNSLLIESTIIQQLILIALGKSNNLDIADYTDLSEHIDRDFLNLDLTNVDSITLKHSRVGTIEYVDFERSKLKLLKNKGENRFKIIVVNTNNILSNKFCDLDDLKNLKTILEMMSGKKDSNKNGIDVEIYKEFRERLPEDVTAIGDYYFLEQKRIEKTSEAWKINDINETGKLLSESALSRSSDRQTKEIVENINRIDGVYGVQISAKSEIIVFADLYLVERIKERIKVILKGTDFDIQSGEISNGVITS
ncbi:MAG: hypothetical protein ACR2NW_05550 [Thermodesulfobacteriota bacterium]